MGSGRSASPCGCGREKTAHYDYWYYDKAIRTTQENRDLLTKLSQIAEARYRVRRAAARISNRPVKRNILINCAEVS
jgi:hypothetical protein